MGKEIWGELLVAALILMLIEGILSNRERNNSGEIISGALGYTVRWVKLRLFFPAITVS